MKEVKKLETERLILRQWEDSDYPLFAEMSSDPVVMEFYPSTLSREESDAMASKIKGLIKKQSWGFWAVETKSDHEFVGFVGLHKPMYELPVAECVEVGWRLRKECWGNGYATEAGKEALRFGFEELNLDEIYSFASILNNRSWAVMERLNMSDTGNNFEHPNIPEGHSLREHVLYKITKGQWVRNAYK